VTIGSNRLTNLDRLTDDLKELLNGPDRKGQVPPLWDGHTAKRSLEQILAASK
jgi:hypothetical protein